VIREIEKKKYVIDVDKIKVCMYHYFLLDDDILTIKF